MTIEWTVVFYCSRRGSYQLPDLDGGLLCRLTEFMAESEYCHPERVKRAEGSLMQQKRINDNLTIIPGRRFFSRYAPSE